MFYHAVFEMFKENVNVIIIFQMLFFSARDDNVERIELALKNGADVFKCNFDYVFFLY
jgi:hypothetical protein